MLFLRDILLQLDDVLLYAQFVFQAQYQESQIIDDSYKYVVDYCKYLHFLPVSTNRPLYIMEIWSHI